MNQHDASRIVLEKSQNETFPYHIEALGLNLVVNEGVFSPKHFHGWETFSTNFPNVKGESVLEIGCGTGVTSVFLAKNGASSVLAMDINPNAVRNTSDNMVRNHVTNMEIRESDIFDSLDVSEKFNVIYWNLPFIRVSEDYQYQSMLERGLFDPGYQFTERFLAQAHKHLLPNGRVIVGLADFADMPGFEVLAKKHHYKMRKLAGALSEEINPVEFLLYELIPLPKLFYAMQFMGKTYEEITTFRRKLHLLATQRDLVLMEQFLDIEEKNAFESHAYTPLFVAKKDHRLLAQASIVLVDYQGPSIGRDCETILANEIMAKRVIAIVADENARNHPYIRLYSDYIVETTEAAFDLAQKLTQFDLPESKNQFLRRQKDRVDVQLRPLLAESHQIRSLIPTELVRRWEVLFNDEKSASAFDWSFHSSLKTVRLNRARISIDSFLALAEDLNWDVQSHPLSPEIFRLKPRDNARPLGLSQEHKDGKFYIQDLASMLPAIALDPQPGECVLDLGAAPGSKTTQMAERMQNKGSILAIDNSESRMKTLHDAVKRMGISIVEAKVEDAATIVYDRNHFDRVLVDGPCSSEGIFGYKPHKMFEWNLLSIYYISEVLEKMAFRGFRSLKPGGTMVFSTCTYSPEENEAVVDALLRHFPEAELEEISLPGIKYKPGLTSWGHQTFDNSLSRTWRILPYENETIGFFLAKIKKTSGTL